MKLVSSLALLLAVAALSVPVSADEKADPKAAALRDLMAKFESKIVTVTWVTKTSAMGQEMESAGSATGIVVGDKGLVAVSAQPFNNPVGGLAGMFGGRGGRGGQGGSTAPTGPENFRVAMGAKSVEALNVLEDKDTNLRFFAGKFEEGKTPAAIAWPEKVSVPALGEEVVILGCYDATLNHARFFKTARINAVIEENKLYGLDGSVQDCLGALVVTYSGNVLGVIAQKNAEDTGAGGGIGGILGGMSDPSKMLGNRVLMTPAVFAATVKKAQEKMADPNFGKPVEKPAEKPPVEKPAEPKPEDPPVELPPEKKHNWRGLTRVIAVDEKVLKGNYGEAKCGIMISAKPEKDSMCEKAGLKNGDLIVKVGDTAIAADVTPDKFWEMIEKIDGSTKITIARFGGKSYELSIDTK
jgi:hypothetical protein